VLSIADYVKEELTPERVLLKIFAWLAIMAVGLSLMGIYGLTSNTVTRRTREIAIRAALGAPRRLVVMLVSRSTLAPTLIGITAGLATAAICALAASRFVFGLVPLHSGAYAATALVMVLIVGLGACSPTIRALRMSATEALRAE
jgi:ABC-type antimicrobial peptide transport system permease subunit